MSKKVSIFSSAVLLFFLINSQVAHAETLNLNVKGVQQEKTNWCWAASAKCVADYLNGYGLSQTQIVTRVKGSAINDGASPTEQKKALNTDGITTTYTNGKISFNEIKHMIKGWYSPILAHIAWSSGGAHAVVIYGYQDWGGISYMDPWSSNSRWNYCSVDYFNSNSDFKWVRTYYNNKHS